MTLVLKNACAKVYGICLTIDQPAFANSMRSKTAAQRLQYVEDLAMAIIRSRARSRPGTVRNFSLGQVSGSTVTPPTATSVFGFLAPGSTKGSTTENVHESQTSRSVVFPTLAEGLFYSTPFSSLLTAAAGLAIVEQVRQSPRSTPLAKQRAQQAKDNYALQRDQLRSIPVALWLYPEVCFYASGGNLYYTDGLVPARFLAADQVTSSAYSNLPAALRTQYAALRTAGALEVGRFLGRTTAATAQEVSNLLTSAYAQHWAQVSPNVVKIADLNQSSTVISSTLAGLGASLRRCVGLLVDPVYTADSGRTIAGSATRSVLQDKLVAALRSATNADVDDTVDDAFDFPRLVTALRTAYTLSSADEPLIEREVRRLHSRSAFDWESTAGTLPRTVVAQMVTDGISPVRWTTAGDFPKLSLAGGVVTYTHSSGNTATLTFRGEGPVVADMTAWTDSTKRSKLKKLLTDYRVMLAILAMGLRAPSSVENWLSTAATRAVAYPQNQIADHMHSAFVPAGHVIGVNWT